MYQSIVHLLGDFNYTGSHILNSVSLLVSHILVLRSWPGNNSNIHLLNFCFLPGALGFFQLVSSVLFKFLWLVCRNVLCFCCNVAWVCVWINLWLVVSVYLPFLTSKYHFGINLYPECDPKISVSLALVWTQPRETFSSTCHLVPFSLWFAMCLTSHFLNALWCVWRRIPTQMYCKFFIGWKFVWFRGECSLSV